MHAKQRLEIELRRDMPVHHLKALIFEGAFNDDNAVGAFGMPRAGFVLEAGRVTNEKRRHAEGSLLSGLRRLRGKNRTKEPQIWPFKARAVHPNRVPIR